jgi:hypothetical protein
MDDFILGLIVGGCICLISFIVTSLVVFLLKNRG